MTIECACGYTCGTTAAFERHLARELPGEHRCLGSSSSLGARCGGMTAEADAKLETTERLVNASEVGDPSTVLDALSCGANVDGTERCSPSHVGHPLTQAACNGHADVVRVLLTHKASLLIGSDRQGVGTILAAAQRGQRRVASRLLAHTREPSVSYRVRSVNTLGSRREATAGELARGQVAALLNALCMHFDGAGASATLAMLVTDGHLQAIEPSGWEGLACRLAGTPGKWLSAQLTRTRENAEAIRARCRHLKDGDWTALLARIDLLLAAGARPIWSPRKHLSYPRAFREQVRTLLLCAQRHGAAASAAGGEHEATLVLGKLPREVVLLLVEALAAAIWAYDDAMVDAGYSAMPVT